MRQMMYDELLLKVHVTAVRVAGQVLNVLMHGNIDQYTQYM
jgi:hypothetical protein